MTRWTVGVVVAITLVVGACGGGGSKKASTTGTTAAGQTATSQASSSGGGGSFCARAVSYAQRYSAAFQKDIGAVIANPTATAARDAFKSDFEATRTAAKSLVSDAPAQIKDDMNLVLSAFDQLFNGLNQVNFDFVKLQQTNPQLLSSLQDPKFAAAAKRLGDYFTTTCHITTPST